MGNMVERHIGDELRLHLFDDTIFLIVKGAGGQHHPFRLDAEQGRALRDALIAWQPCCECRS